MRALLILLFSGAAFAAEPLVVTCRAPFLSEEALRAQFGAKNVTRESIYLAEGEEAMGSVVFAGDETRRIEIVWKDAKKRRNPEFIRIPASATQVKTYHELRIGLRLRDLERINGAPFRFSGFGWDYGGNVISWGKGKLAKPAADGCRVQVSITSESEEAGAISGDIEVSSTHPLARKLQPTVDEIILSFP